MSATYLFASPMASSVQVATGSRRPSASFYDILRVNRNASSLEIKTAYRTLAKIYHPDSVRRSTECDSSFDDGCSFLEIHNAYETLSDPATRAHYDLALAAITRRPFLRSSRSRPHRRWETDQCW
ncbi:chaperone protein dnaJ 11, chloroplastic [Benincasa hispida]|uniref:chaperone protein dnaJ 11, chloroplastic n=1 Tax=Benincasa hispida TaxID=102211 RepID=UPI0019021AFF|nr:chaperone protein dnaJ 11, chloroplastic [Benincasa hispida]